MNLIDKLAQQQDTVEKARLTKEEERLEQNKIEFNDAIKQHAELLHKNLGSLGLAAFDDKLFNLELFRRHQDTHAENLLVGKVIEGTPSSNRLILVLHDEDVDPNYTLLHGQKQAYIDQEEIEAAGRLREVNVLHSANAETASEQDWEEFNIERVEKFSAMALSIITNKLKGDNRKLDSITQDD